MVWGLVLLFTIVIPALIIWGGMTVSGKLYGQQRAGSGDERGKWEYDPVHRQKIFVYDQRTPAQKAAEQGKRDLGGCLIFIVLPLVIYVVGFITWFAVRM